MTTQRMSSGTMLVREIIGQTGALTEGHFAHGRRHTAHWIAVERLYTKPQHMTNIYRLLATRLQPYRPDVVLGLAPDGIALAHAVGAAIAPHLEDKDHTINFACAYLDPLYRYPFGYETLVPGRRVAVVQHIIASGATVRRMGTSVESLGGEVVAVGAVIDRARRGAEVLHGVPVETLCDYTLDDWPADTCPLCREGMPMTA